MRMVFGPDPALSATPTEAVPASALRGNDPGYAPWQFNGEDRWDWPNWVKGHQHTAEHMPYGPDGESFITCCNKSYVMLAPKGFWLTMAEDGAMHATHPDWWVQSSRNPATPPTGE